LTTTIYDDDDDNNNNNIVYTLNKEAGISWSVQCPDCTLDDPVFKSLQGQEIILFATMSAPQG
jgi:hypothetical protein